jgi:hypothetical protein
MNQEKSEMNRKKTLRTITGFVAVVLLAAVSGFGQRADRTVAEVYSIDDGSPIPDAYSTLVRTKSGISMTIHASGLRPGAYTAWWVTENYPQYCSERPCSMDDEANPLVQSSVFNATGAIVGEDGVGNFAAYTSPGAQSSDVLFGPGLLNPRGADVYIVVRYHGPVIPDQIKEQLTTYDGGCSVNECSDELISFHISNS